MARLTIDDVLKGHAIRQNTTRPKVNWQLWLLDAYPQPFPHKIYAAIVAVAVTEAKEKISFRDLKVYALRLVAADRSEDYFKGERGFNIINKERADFSAEVGEMKAWLASSPSSATELEAVIGSELGEIERIGGMQLRMLATGINDVAKSTITYMKRRKGVPCFEPLKDPDKPRTFFYALIR